MEPPIGSSPRASWPIGRWTMCFSLKRGSWATGLEFEEKCLDIVWHSRDIVVDWQILARSSQIWIPVFIWYAAVCVATKIQIEVTGGSWCGVLGSSWRCLRGGATAACHYIWILKLPKIVWNSCIPQIFRGSTLCKICLEAYLAS